MRLSALLLVILLPVTLALAPIVACGSDDDGEVSNANNNTESPQNGETSTCGEGLTVCANTCVNVNTNEAHCGSCGTACDADQICDQGSCLDQSTDCTTEPCAGMTYCDEATGECLPGCTDDAQCGANSVCDLSTNDCECEAGFHSCGGLCVPSDSPQTCGTRCDPCPSVDGAQAICEDGECGLSCDAGLTYCAESDSCRECCGHADCDDDSYCSDASTCESIVDAGYCLNDQYCGSEEECNLSTLTCTEIIGGSGSCNAPCGSTYASVCVNDRCISRYENTPCRDGSSCGHRLGCSPVTFTCYNPNSCSETVHSCGPGLRCGWLTSQHTCLNTEGRECESDYPCHGIACNVEEERCEMRIQCSSSNDCNYGEFVSDNALTCYQGECTPWHEVRCQSQDDCNDGFSSGSDWHCVEEIGYCARG